MKTTWVKNHHKIVIVFFWKFEIKFSWLEKFVMVSSLLKMHSYKTKIFIVKFHRLEFSIGSNWVTLILICLNQKNGYDSQGILPEIFLRKTFLLFSLCRCNWKNLSGIYGFGSNPVFLVIYGIICKNCSNQNTEIFHWVQYHKIFTTI